MSSEKKIQVCVIGAGLSGLIAIKELLDEGHEVICFEKYDKVGGVFYYSDSKGGVYDSTLLTNSNFMMAFSCFPPELSEKRKYWTRQDYADYLSAFVQHFELDKHIHFNKNILSVTRTPNETYAVKIADSNNENNVESMEFGAIAVCSGTHQIPKQIKLKGSEHFKDKIFHSAYYKNAQPYTDKRVLCVGIGETGADVTHEIAQVSKSCVLSLRHYQAIAERFPWGREHPNDAYTSYMLYAIPIKAQNLQSTIALKVLERFSGKQEAKEFAKWNLKAGNYYNQFFTKNEIFFNSIVEKKLTVNASGINRLEENRVIFNDGSSEDIDVVMLNTGYVDTFPFLEDVDITNVRQLYKHIIHPDLGAGIAIIGRARPAVGGLPACSEMQCRYFALLCSGKKQLPEKNQLERLIAQQADFEERVYFQNPQVKALIHYTRYMNDFAKIIGCYPLRLSSFMNPRLIYRLWFGSQLPSIFRLYGPHSDPKQATHTIYRTPIAFNLFEIVSLSLYAIVTRILAKLGLITPDPKY